MRELDDEPIAVVRTEEESLWVEQRRLRLENEWRRLRWNYAYHANVRVTPLEGDPPEQYQVEYRLRTVAFDESDQLQYVKSAMVHIWLPPEFPHAPPLFRPMGRLFHPNLTPDGILLIPPWQPKHTLAEMVGEVGRLLAYQEVDLSTPWDPTATAWATANMRLLPLDASVDLSATAGGEPQVRIARLGGRTLQRLRDELKRCCDELVGGGEAFSPQRHSATVAKMRQRLGLFLEDDAPADLKGEAEALDAWASALPRSLPAFERLRSFRAI